MQSGRWFVKNIQSPRARTFREMRRELDSLRFTARKRRRRLAQAKITQAYFIQHAQTICDLIYVAEEGDRLAHSHVQNIVNVLAAITHVEDLLFEARAFAFFADEFDVREKLHLDRDRAVALTNFATP